MKDDIIVDFSGASVLERTVLMCMERIAELERRMDLAEATRKESEVAHKERKALIIEIMSFGSKYNTILLDVMQFLIGPQWNPEDIHIKQHGDDNNSERVHELCTIAKRGIQGKSVGLKKAWDLTSPSEFDACGMLDAMSTEELKDFLKFKRGLPGPSNLTTYGHPS